MGCDGRTSPSAMIARTSGVCADGEVVWFWRSNAGAKVVKTLSRLTGDGGNQAMVTGKSTKETVKTIAQGRPDDPPVPVVLPRAFLLHADHGCGGHPAFPVPSSFWRDANVASARGTSRPAGAVVCRWSSCSVRPMLP